MSIDDMDAEAASDGEVIDHLASIEVGLRNSDDLQLGRAHRRLERLRDFVKRIGSKR